MAAEPPRWKWLGRFWDRSGFQGHGHRRITACRGVDLVPRLAPCGSGTRCSVWRWPYPPEHSLPRHPHEPGRNATHPNDSGKSELCPVCHREQLATRAVFHDACSLVACASESVSSGRGPWLALIASRATLCVRSFLGEALSSNSDLHYPAQRGFAETDERLPPVQPTRERECAQGCAVTFLIDPWCVRVPSALAQHSVPPRAHASSAKFPRRLRVPFCCLGT